MKDKLLAEAMLFFTRYFLVCLLLFDIIMINKNTLFISGIIFFCSIFSTVDAAYISTLEEECSEGKGKSCAQAGVYYENSDIPDLKKAEKLYLKGCDLDDMFSCGALLYLPDSRDPAAFAATQKKEQNDASDKVNSGKKTLDHYIRAFNKREPSTDLKSIYQAISEYCSSGDGTACLYSGVMNNYGLGTRKNLKKAVSNYENACDSNNSKACYNLGFMYEFGKGVVKSAKTALNLFERGCALKDGKACNSAGYLYEFGHEIKRNRKTASEFFERGCDLNDGASCRNRAWLYVKGKGKYHDPDRAFLYFSKGCDLNDAKSCSSVGYSYLHGNGTKRDVDMARKYYKIACAKGHQKSCKFNR